MAPRERQQEQLQRARVEEEPLLPAFEDELYGELQAEEDQAERRFLTKALFSLGAYFFVGGLFFCRVCPLEGKEAPTLIDSLYFTVVTLTTVGYGDFHPDLANARCLLFTCCFVLSGIGFVSMFLSYLVGLMFEQEAAIIHRAACGDDPEKPGILGLSRKDRSLAISLFTLAALMLIGTAVFTYAEGLTVVQAFYLVCVSISTVGFGDEVPLTQGTKLFSVFWLSFATMSLAKTISDVVNWRLSRKLEFMRKKLLYQRINHRRFARLDRDGDGEVSKLEYLCAMLADGKWDVTQEDIDAILARFEALDVDADGELSLQEAGGGHSSVVFRR